jgi:type IV pilus assembly protein PilC
MAIIFTPSQFSRRAEFYQQLSQLTAAGLGLITALGHLEKKPPARSYREPIREVLDRLSSGFTLSESLRHLDRQWLPEFDIALIQAGEQSGRLDACFSLLGDYYAERAQLARQMITDLAYPVFLLHFFIFIVPFPQLYITGNLARYGLQTLGVLAPLYGLMLVVVYATQSKHGERWRSVIETLLHPVPVLGGARRCLALARLAAALEALLSAGVTIIEAWELAAAACGSPALRRAVLAWRPALDGGVTPSEAINASGVFPDIFSGQYATGEVSGQLEDVLKRLHGYYQAEGSRKLRGLSRWVPILLYLVLVLCIAAYVLNFYTKRYQGIFKLLNLDQ